MSADRKQIKILMALWNRVCPLKDAQGKRDARLRFLSERLGRRINSAKELTEAELKQAINALLLEVRPGQRNNLRQFPNRSQVSRKQLWKIRQLEAWLGWSSRPERLQGFLRSKFHCDRPEYLFFAQAWRTIEALFNLAARERLKAESGWRGPVSKKELSRERKALKESLRYWVPPPASPGLPTAA